jgi:hypothetical protein
VLSEQQIPFGNDNKKSKSSGKMQEQPQVLRLRLRFTQDDINFF